MFDAIRNNKKIVQVFLVLIALPFAFFGLESYVSSDGVGADVAKVGEIKISQQEFQQSMREQQERLRSQLGQVDPKMLDNPEFRKAILDDLIDQRLLAMEAGKRRLFANDETVRRTIGAIEAFQQDGQFLERTLRSAAACPGHVAGRFRGAGASGSDPAATGRNHRPDRHAVADRQRTHPGPADRAA